MHRSLHNIPCIGCGALVPDIDGPTFRYPNAASPGCWAVYGEILAMEYGPLNYPRAHHLTVDTYAVQHPGRPTPETIQSVTVHLISLGCVLERGYPSNRATEMMRRAIGRYKGSFEWLPSPESLGTVTVLDVVGARTLTEHTKRAERWARSVWQAWAEHHDAIRAWIEKLEG